MTNKEFFKPGILIQRIDKYCWNIVNPGDVVQVIGYSDYHQGMVRKNGITVTGCSFQSWKRVVVIKREDVPCKIHAN